MLSARRGGRRETNMKLILMALLFAGVFSHAAIAFDGRKWNISTGNLSVGYISSSPIGAHPTPGAYEAPPPVEALVGMKEAGLVAYEDYIAWGAVEREPGKWDWTQHDREFEAIKKAGLHYVAYNWVHFPPVWLRESKDRTLMRCVEHRRDTNYLSIFDPKTIQHYDRFYKALHDHFGDRIDGVYACILGPYGEGNYPLDVRWLIDIGHCHEGYWCADPYALASFRDAMRRKYGSVAALNAAWQTTLRSFAQLLPPHEIAEGLKPAPEVFKTAADRRRWLDFITWYHQAIIDFAEQSIKVVLKYYPREKVRAKPGGNAGGVNPIAWGTYCPGYAKMAAKYGIVLQPADCQGAVFGDKWVGTAYHFYGVKLSTEPAGGLDRNGFVRRMFSDASCGASQLFTYAFDQHAPDIRKYAHLMTGRPGDTSVAVLCPTTLYRLGGDLGPTIRAADSLRDFTDFDVLDELLILDGALTKRYRALVIPPGIIPPGIIPGGTDGDYVEQAVLDRIEAWVREGGTLIVAADIPIRNVEGAAWPLANTTKLGLGNVITAGEKTDRLHAALAPFATDGVIDGVWTTKRGTETLLYNTTDHPVKRKVKSAGTEAEVEVEPYCLISRP